MLIMGKRRIRIEFDDGKGGNYTITLDGSISRDKTLKIIDMVELLGGTQKNDKPMFTEGTVLEKIYNLIEQQFPLGLFSSSDLLEAYEDKYNHPIKLSTVSTYLYRLTEKGLLKKEKSMTGWTYRMIRVGTI
jgi:hypothetical protein